MYYLSIIFKRIVGSVSYNIQDRFALDGRRLIKIAETENKVEYRFEIEDYSKVYAFGPETCNPTYWEYHLPNGTIQTLGKTQVCIFNFSFQIFLNKLW